MPKGSPGVPKPKKVLPKAAKEMASKLEELDKNKVAKDDSGLTCSIPNGPVKDHFKKMYDLYEREQMMQYEQGFGYNAPGKRWTKCEDLLPSDGEEVLVLCPGTWPSKNDPLYQRSSFKVFQGTFRCTEGWCILSLDRRPPVFAWMNIPEIPDSWMQEIKDHG